MKKSGPVRLHFPVLTLSALLTLSACGQQNAQAPNIGQLSAVPYAPQVLQHAQGARAKVILFSNGRSTLKHAVERLSLCSASQCVDLPVVEVPEAYVTSRMSYLTLSDVLIPQGTYDQIQIQVAAKVHTIRKTVAVRDAHRTDIFLDLNHLAPETTYAAEVSFQAARSFLLTPGPEVLHLNDQVTLTLPSTAVREPVITSTTIHDTRDEYPLVDFYPDIELDSSAELQFTKLRDDHLNVPYVASVQTRKNIQRRDSATRPSGLTAKRKADMALSLTTSKLGIFSLNRGQPTVEFDDGRRAVLTPAEGTVQAQALTTQCGQNLYSNLSAYQNILNSQGSLRITECEGIFPYVHIVAVNMNYASYNSQIGMHTVYEPTISRRVKSTTPQRYVYGLDSIRDLASAVNAFTSINGYTWYREYLANIGWAYQEGNDAEPTTTVMNGNVIEHAEREGRDEAIISFSSNSNGYIFGNYVRHTAGTAIPSQAYSRAAIGSRTTVLSAGNCATFQTSPEMLSAIGFGNNRLILVSSTHRGQAIVPSDLCEVFQGLNANAGAVLMDGSSAAAITYGTSGHLNPVPGTESFENGMRQIAYSFALTKKSMYIPPTSTD